MATIPRRVVSTQPAKPTRVSPGIYRNPQGGLVKQGVPAPKPAAPNTSATNPSYGRYLKEYQNAGTNDIRRQQIDKVWGFSKNAKTAYKPPAATTPAPETAQPTTPPPTTTPPADTAAPAVETPTFKSVYDFMPKDYTATPMYEFQKQQGSKDLARLMAARGLTNSGAEIEANSKFLNQLGAQEAERAMGTALNDANRYDNQSQYDATQSYNRGNDQWTRMMDLLNYTQRNSPYESGVNANNSIAGLNVDAGKNMAGYFKDAYGRVIAGGGGGGGGSLPPFMAPAPSGPDTSMSDMYKIMNSGNSNGGFLKDLARLFSGG